MPENKGLRSRLGWTGENTVQGGIAQTIGLVFAANARRQGMAYPSWPNASIYQFCNKVSFVGRKRPILLGFSKAVEIVDPNAWLDSLPRDMSAARLCVLARNNPNISDRDSVGFANGGPVFLAQIAAPTPEAWYGEWQVTNQGASDQRIWSVTYRNLPNVDGGILPRSQQEVRDNLARALEDAIEFNSSHNLGFGDTFAAAKTALNGERPLDGYYHGDLVPAELLSLSDLQIFSCAAKAWVFGGMGSWNDVWFEGDDYEVYRELSDRLFSAIVDGLVLATNASGAA